MIFLSDKNESYLYLSVNDFQCMSRSGSLRSNGIKLNKYVHLVCHTVSNALYFVYMLTLTVYKALQCFFEHVS
jgi:hypothetical protein